MQTLSFEIEGLKWNMFLVPGNDVDHSHQTAPEPVDNQANQSIKDNNMRIRVACRNDY